VTAREETTMLNRRRILACFAIALVTTAIGAAATAGTPPELGRLFDEIAAGGGVLENSSRPVASGAITRTVSVGGVVHLDNGEVLRFGANSAARFDAADDGRVKVFVLSGRLSMVDQAGRVLWAGAGSKFTVAPARRDVMQVESTLLSIDDVDPETGWLIAPRELEQALERAR
jgi:hypothetical protein